jgi:hypothetical protein
MEQIANNQVGSTPPVGAAPPMPTAQPTPVAQPMPQMPMDNSDLGGGNGAFIKKDGGIKDFFSDINILDVTISAFVVGGIFYAIYYYKYMMMLEKSAYADMSTRVQKLESALAAQKAELNASGKMDKAKRRPLMRLG